MSNLKVGDVCEIIKSDSVPEALGLECSVVTLMPGSRKDVKICIPGFIGPRGHDIWNIEAHCLRLKPPPSNSNGEPSTDFTPANNDDWASTFWTPGRVKVTL